MKKKILFFGWNKNKWAEIQNEIHNFLEEDFQYIFAHYDIDALDEIAKAKFLQNDPIRIVVFKRDTLCVSTSECWLIGSFAEEYLKPQKIIIISLMNGDEDEDAIRDGMFGQAGRNLARESDWQQIATIIQKVEN